ncbi:alpha-2-glucosyltransferase Alg10 [Spinellus fusiger]|nr:alpha-2-glucosyltransferase Alg10 [Spinellus fusiger]
MHTSSPVVLVLAVASTVLYWQYDYLQEHIKETYMDEIFHVPQVQRYCSGHYATWDPKLTTPPGLYVISHSLSFVWEGLGYHGCTLSALRSINAVFSIGLFLVLYRLLAHTHPLPTVTRSLYALALTWFPILFFFNGLYYTDNGSTFFVFLCYLLIKERWYWCAGWAGSISVTFRQTNIIWVAFFMVLAIVQCLQEAEKKNLITTTLYNPLCKDIKQPMDMVHSLSSLIVGVTLNLRLVLSRMIVFIMTMIGFVVFLIWNGGIVLGDRSNHIAGYHVPQLFYFSSFLSVFMAPWMLSISNIEKVISYFKSPKRVILYLVQLALSVYAVHKFTYEHPFLLSDNRHYTFYLWKNVYRYHWAVRYALTPFYLISQIINVYSINANMSFLTALGYAFSLILTLIPSPLLEFRYFILPFLFYALHLRPTLIRTGIALVVYGSMNSILAYLFVHSTFEWPNEPGVVQRFMW